MFYLFTTPTLQVYDYDVFTPLALQVCYMCCPYQLHKFVISSLSAIQVCYLYLYDVFLSIVGDHHNGQLVRHMSQESMASINSMSSACSGTSQLSSNTDTDSARKKKKKNWVSKLQFPIYHQGFPKWYFIYNFKNRVSITT